MTPTEDCKTCNGTGQASKYDLGWKSLMHEPRLAAKERCPVCGGSGKSPVLSDVID